MGETADELYDDEFIAGLSEYSDAGNCLVVALTKDPERKLDCAKRQIEEWYLMIPEEWRSHFFMRLRSKHDGDFLGAAWELCVYACLQRTPGATVVDHEVSADRGTVDFEVTVGDETVAVECYILREGQDRQQDSSLQSVFRKECEANLPDGCVVVVHLFIVDPEICTAEEGYYR
jgi:hypothetical protein